MKIIETVAEAAHQRAPHVATVNGELVLTAADRAWLREHRWCYVDGTSAHLDNPLTGATLLRAFKAKPRLKLRVSGRIDEIE